MAIWLTRAGSHGEYEQKFLQDNRVYVTWDHLSHDLSKLTARDQLFRIMTEIYPGVKPKAIHNWVSQVWPFAHEIKKGDLAILPLKTQPTIYIGEIQGDYHFEPAGPDPYFHWRPVKWIGEAIPRANFSQDLLYSFGAFMTICRIQRNNAEVRILAMRANGWKAETTAPRQVSSTSDAAEAVGDTDLEQLAQDQIAQLIAARFVGHGLTRTRGCGSQSARLHNVPQSRRGRRRSRYTGWLRRLWIRGTSFVCASEIRCQPDRQTDGRQVAGCHYQVWCAGGAICVLERVQGHGSKRTRPELLPCQTVESKRTSCTTFFLLRPP
jgi:hypothetical protein